MPPYPRFDDRCDELRSIDLAYLRRRGMLEPGTHRRLTWSRQGQVVSSIGIHSSGDAVTLRYRSRSRGSDDWHDIVERIALVWTPTCFGGRRSWLECPGCRRGCRIIYEAGPRYRCRRCTGLHYSSQYEAAGLGALGRAEKIRKRLGDHDGLAFDGEPMHWRTYRRLEERYDDLQTRWTVAALARFGFRGPGT